MMYFEDFTPGQAMRFGDVRVDEADIVAFARRFDAQDFHIDPAAAQGTFVGELIASGWHSCALLMRLVADGFVIDSAGMGAPGIDEVKWLAPVRPGDHLHAKAQVIDIKSSEQRPDRGRVKFRFDLVNQHGETVLEQTNWIIFGRRGRDGPIAPKVATDGGWRYLPPAMLSLSQPPQGQETLPRGWFDDLQVGKRVALGSFVFTPEEIIAFASRFDPQPFHLDADAARQSAFGRLCASGWHTAAVWMMLMIEHRKRAAAALPMGEPAPRLGSSPGFKNLKWLKPVYAGDTLRFFSETVDKRVSRSRPEWGLAFQLNGAVNQNDVPVFQFDGCVFWERRLDVVAQPTLP